MAHTDRHTVTHTDAHRGSKTESAHSANSVRNIGDAEGQSTSLCVLIIAATQKKFKIILIYTFFLVVVLVFVFAVYIVVMHVLIMIISVVNTCQYFHIVLNLAKL